MPAGLSSVVLQSQAVFTVVFAAAAAAGAARAGGRSVGPGRGRRRRWRWSLAARPRPAGRSAFALVLGAAAAWGVANVAIRRAAPADMLGFMVWVSAVAAPVLVVLTPGRRRSGAATWPHCASSTWTAVGGAALHRRAVDAGRLGRRGGADPPVRRLDGGAVLHARAVLRHRLGALSCWASRCITDGHHRRDVWSSAGCSPAPSATGRTGQPTLRARQRRAERPSTASDAVWARCGGAGAADGGPTRLMCRYERVVTRSPAGAGRTGPRVS